MNLLTVANLSIGITDGVFRVEMVEAASATSVAQHQEVAVIDGHAL